MWMVCLGNKLRSFCYFWDCTQVLHFGLFCWLWGLFHFCMRFFTTVMDNGHLSEIHPFQCIFVPWFLKRQHHCCHLLFDHFQYTLIHGPNTPGSYAILFFTAWTLLSPPDTFTTGHCFCFGSISSFLLVLFTVYTVILYTYLHVTSYR